jgi:hypothetical protein
VAVGDVDRRLGDADLAAWADTGVAAVPVVNVALAAPAEGDDFDLRAVGGRGGLGSRHGDQRGKTQQGAQDQGTRSSEGERLRKDALVRLMGTRALPHRSLLREAEVPR